MLRTLYFFVGPPCVTPLLRIWKSRSRCSLMKGDTGSDTCTWWLMFLPYKNFTSFLLQLPLLFPISKHQTNSWNITLYPLLIPIVSIITVAYCCISKDPREKLCLNNPLSFVADPLPVGPRTHGHVGRGNVSHVPVGRLVNCAAAWGTTVGLMVGPAAWWDGSRDMMV